MELFYDQRRRSHWEITVDDASCSEAQFCREFYKQPMRIHGSVPADRLTVILPARRGKETATFCGRELLADTFAACLPRDPITLCTPDKYRYINFSVSINSLDHAFRTLHQCSLKELIPQTAIRSVPVGLVSRLRWAVRAAFADGATCTNGLLREGAVIEALASALSAGQPPLDAGLATRNYWGYVRTVRDFVEANLGKPLNIKMLCQVALVSERTLTNAFRVILGVSPLQFIKAHRLNAARHLLSTPSGKNKSVKWVAGCLGFTHLGYFARDYRLHFGESPSMTLASEGSNCKK